MIDAPVSGGTGGAVAGTLTFIVGGEADTLEAARPYLEKMGKNIFHAGAAGAWFVGISGLLLLRSEEHTSELQSLMRISYAVFCLKKKIPLTQNTHTTYDLHTF